MPQGKSRKPGDRYAEIGFAMLVRQDEPFSVNRLDSGEWLVLVGERWIIKHGNLPSIVRELLQDKKP